MVFIKQFKRIINLNFRIKHNFTDNVHIYSPENSIFLQNFDTCRIEIYSNSVRYVQLNGLRLIEGHLYLTLRTLKLQ